MSPVAIGTTRISARQFVLINALSAAVWGITFSAIGYVFGHAFETLLSRLLTPTYVAIAAGVILIVALVIWLVRRRQTAAARAT